mgnify:CR=1 FL=1
MTNDNIHSYCSAENCTIVYSVLGTSWFQTITDLVYLIAQRFYFIVELCVRLCTDGDHNFFGFKEFFPVVLIDNDDAAVLNF